MTTPPNDTPEAADFARRRSALPEDLRREVLWQGTFPILRVAEECARLRTEVARLVSEKNAAHEAHDADMRNLALASGLPVSPVTHLMAEVCRRLSSLPTKEGTPGDGGKVWPEIHGPAGVVLGEVRELASTIAGLTHRVEDLEPWRRVYVQGVGERLEDLERAAEETAGAVLTVDERLPGGSGPVLRVYLAGPINGCSDEEARSWRQRFRVLVPSVTCVDPMDLDMRGLEDGNEAQIVTHDKRLIASCDVLLANPWRPSVGTPMEVLFAWMLGLEVVVIGARSPWYVAHATHTVPTVEAAASLLGGRG